MKNGIYEEIVNNKILEEIDNDNLIVGKEKLDNGVIRPETSISRTSLFTGSKREPNLNEEMKKEIVSSDEIKSY